MKRRARVALLKLHRRVGLLVAAFVVFLTVTGVLINHTHTLGWDQRPITSALWLRLYGIEPARVSMGFPVRAHWISWASSQLYLDDQPLAGCDETLIGAVPLPDEAGLGQGGLALCSDAIILFTFAGDVIEKIPLAGVLPERLALKDGVIYAQQKAGSPGDADRRLLQFDLEAGRFLSPGDPAAGDPAAAVPAAGNPMAELEWSMPRPLPESLARRLPYTNIPHDLSLERLLLDLHSGRLFGPVGVWGVDIAGLLMLLLALTGLWTLLIRRH